MGLYRVYIGIMEKRMETTIQGFRVRGNRVRVQGFRDLGFRALGIWGSGL